MGQTEIIKASKWRRVVALLIDAITINFVLLTLTMYPLGVVDDFSLGIMLILSAIFGVKYVLYLFKDVRKGVSVGKWFMGIMIKNEDGTIPSTPSLYGRNVSLLFYPLDICYLLFNKNNQRFAESMSGTIVVFNLQRKTASKRFVMFICYILFMIVVLFVTRIVSLKTTEYYRLAINEIEKNEEIIKETGGIRGYGWYVEGSEGGGGLQRQSSLYIKVKGKVKDIDVIASSAKNRGDEEWFGTRVYISKKR